MQNKVISVVVASALMFVTQAGMAASSDEYYFGIQYGIGDYDEDGLSNSFSPTALMARVGLNVNSNLSVEGRLGFGLQDDTQFLAELGGSGLDAQYELDSIIGVYALGHVDLAESSSIYGLLGVSRVKANANVPEFPAARNCSSDSSFSYGVGADFGISDNVALNIEYTQYLNKSNADLGLIALGATFSF
ncbi:porin family protein [Pseudomonadota bacterium]